MIKTILIFISILLGFSSFIGMDILTKEKGDTNNLKVPENPVMTFSYDVKTLTYNTLVNENDRSRLKPHQKFMFVPQEEKMHVEGYLSYEGLPYYTIDILEKTNRPWIKMQDSQLPQKKEVRKIVIEGKNTTSYDDKGEKIISFSNDKTGNKELADALIEKLDPQKAFKEYLVNAIDKGWNVKHINNTIRIQHQEEENDITMFINKLTGLPKQLIVKTSKEISNITYKFDCIDGKWVLVLIRTKIKKVNPEIDIEYNSVTTMNNFNIEIN